MTVELDWRTQVSVRETAVEKLIVRCGDLALDARIRFADAVQAAVDVAYANVKATARKSGRRSEWPYVPVLRYVRADGRVERTEQILGAAYATRAEAVEMAERALWDRRVALTRKLCDPRDRALREYHGLPREIPS